MIDLLVKAARARDFTGFKKQQDKGQAIWVIPTSPRQLRFFDSDLLGLKGPPRGAFKVGIWFVVLAGHSALMTFFWLCCRLFPRRGTSNNGLMLAVPATPGEARWCSLQPYHATPQVHAMPCSTSLYTPHHAAPPPHPLLRRRVGRGGATAQGC